MEHDERALLMDCARVMHERHGTAPTGWLSPWISESRHTPDLLAECGYQYTLNWCHDEQPLVMGIALHPYIVGQPYRLKHLRRALKRVAHERNQGNLWVSTPGAICLHAALSLADDPAPGTT